MWLNETFPFERRRKFFWAILLFFVFVSGFLAWRDEHLKVEQVRDSVIATQGSVRAQVTQVLQENAKPYAIPKQDEEAIVFALASSGWHSVEI